MDYFEILDFKKEPFSNSPDPEFFYQARPHVQCLQKLELSLRLRRGLNVVTGEVGTGKTTLCRHLIRKFAGDDKIETHLVLDPSYSSPMEFLHAVAKMFCPSQSTHGLSEWQLKEMIKDHLFRTGVDEKKIVILLIDEGQRLPDYCLEMLREFLNYETNEYKLLQIVIFAQTEFNETLKRRRGFADRINLYHLLGPLDFEETKSLIRFRLERASKGKANASLISPSALRVIYKASGGYPRRTIHLYSDHHHPKPVQGRVVYGTLLCQEICQGRNRQIASNSKRHPHRPPGPDRHYGLRGRWFEVPRIQGQNEPAFISLSGQTGCRDPADRHPFHGLRSRPGPDMANP